MIIFKVPEEIRRFFRSRQGVAEAKIPGNTKWRMEKRAALRLVSVVYAVVLQLFDLLMQLGINAFRKEDFQKRLVGDVAFIGQELQFLDH